MMVIVGNYPRLCNRVFSRDVTAAMLVSLNKGTAAMLVSPTNPLGIELYSYANVFFCFGWKTCSLITWVKTLYRLFSRDVTAAMLVSPTNPLGIELYSYANVFFCFGWKTCSLITWVKTLYRWKTATGEVHTRLHQPRGVDIIRMRTTMEYYEGKNHGERSKKVKIALT